MFEDARARQHHGTASAASPAGPAPGQPGGRPTPFGMLGDRGDRVLALVLLGWLALHALISLGSWQALGFDDAQQALWAQQWAWGYESLQPPLYTWITRALLTVFGEHLAVFVLLRYVLIGAGLVLWYAVARRMLPSRTAARTAAAAYTLLYLIGHNAHVNLTHSLLLFVALGGTTLVWLQLVARPSLGRYALFGLWLGIGVLAKYNYGLFVVALLGAAVSMDAMRARVLDPRLLLSGLVAVLLLAPHAWWWWHENPWSVAAAGEHLLVAPEGGHAGWASALVEIIEAPLTFLLPLLPVFALCYGRSLVSSRFRLTDPGARLFWRQSVLGWGLFAGILLVEGANETGSHWMIAIFPAAPILLIALAQTSRSAETGADRWFRGTIIALVLAVLAIRLGDTWVGPRRCTGCAKFQPIPALAQRLAQDGLDRPGVTFIATSIQLGGNLALVLDAATATTVRLYPTEAAQEPATQVRYLLWRTDQPHEERMHAFLTQYGADIADPTPERIYRLPMPRYPERSLGFALARLPAVGK